jgi:transposase InsO family protein
MDLHSGARTCPASRALLARRITIERWTVATAAAAAGISVRTAYKWLARARGGDLRDRSSRPHRSPRATPEAWQELIVKLRRSRLTGAQIAARLKLRRSTVARVLQRAGLARLRSLEPAEPVVRYEWQRPGDLVHLDVKKLGRFRHVGHRIHGDRSRRSRPVGWEYVHVAIDDYSRVAYVEVLPNELGVTTAFFLRRALAWFKGQGIRVRRLLSDNGSGYVSKVFRARCAAERVRHLRTRAYRPQTNGKAERFIQTLLREWAYVRPYPTSRHRRAALPHWLTSYNRRRPHGSLHGQPPFSRLGVRREQRA